jgi:hypothetical protein
MSIEHPAPHGAPSGNQRPASRGGFGGSGRPRRRLASPKAPVMTPEARRALEEKNQRLIDEAVAKGRITRCPVRWASGSVPTGTFGATEA